MRHLARPRVVIGLAVLGLAAGTWALAQQTGTPPAAPSNAAPPPAPPAASGTPATAPKPAAVEAAPPPPANAVAGTVNAQPIPELAIYRVLYKQKPKNPDEARTEVLNFLIETALVDQYVARFPNTVVDAKEVDEKITQMKKEAKDGGEDFEKILKEMHLTQEDLRDQLNKGLRWDKFCIAQASEKVLRDFFDKNKSMFDGSQVRARHILVTATDKTPQAGEQAKTKAATIKKVIEDAVAEELKKLPAAADNLEGEKERRKLLENAFALAASEKSECPSKKEGGDVGWFRRVGDMVEPFARVAFALKAYQMSDVVSTEFGYHVILTAEQKQGKEVQFDEAKSAVMEVYCDRLRDAIVAREKPTAKIVTNPAPK
jgi:peptidyl-prolyl cis-trans isomerase C